MCKILSIYSNSTHFSDNRRTGHLAYPLGGLLQNSAITCVSNALPTLGILSSFLGIGGGPINVALLIFVFSFPIKTATFYSIITILFAQLSKLISIVMGVGFFSFNLSMLPPLIIGAILGGFIGAKLNKMLSEKTLICAFNVVQVIVLCICVFNILDNGTMIIKRASIIS